MFSQTQGNCAKCKKKKAKLKAQKQIVHKLAFLLFLYHGKICLSTKVSSTMGKTNDDEASHGVDKSSLHISTKIGVLVERMAFLFVLFGRLRYKIEHEAVC